MRAPTRRTEHAQRSGKGSDQRTARLNVLREKSLGGGFLGLSLILGRCFQTVAVRVSVSMAFLEEEDDPRTDHFQGTLLVPCILVRSGRNTIGFGDDKIF